jgi:hypothetical protein
MGIVNQRTDCYHFAQIDFVQSFLTKKLSFCAPAQNDYNYV